MTAYKANVFKQRVDSATSMAGKWKVLSTALQNDKRCTALAPMVRSESLGAWSWRLKAVFREAESDCIS
jgi:hypothetical protein